MRYVITVAYSYKDLAFIQHFIFRRAKSISRECWVIAIFVSLVAGGLILVLILGLIPVYFSTKQSTTSTDFSMYILSVCFNKLHNYSC